MGQVRTSDRGGGLLSREGLGTRPSPGTSQPSHTLLTETTQHDGPSVDVEVSGSNPISLRNLQR